MAKVTTKKVPGIIKAVSTIDYVYGALLIVGALLLFLGGTLLASLGILSKILPSGIVGEITGGALILGAVIMLVLGIVYVYLGKAILQYKKWAQVVQIILAILGLFSFPIGTVIGVFMLWVLLINKDTRKLFK
ncbi:MAG: hypothetical protein ABIB47_04880 [Candidatus Woesearchaeota archaeon]